MCMYVCMCIVSHYFSLLALSGIVVANILLYNLDLFVIMNLCMYVCMSICMYVCMYVCMYRYCEQVMLGSGSRQLR